MKIPLNLEAFFVPASMQFIVQFILFAVAYFNVTSRNRQQFVCSQLFAENMTNCTRKYLDYVSTKKLETNLFGFFLRVCACDIDTFASGFDTKCTVEIGMFDLTVCSIFKPSKGIVYGFKTILKPSHFKIPLKNGKFWKNLLFHDLRTKKFQLELCKYMAFWDWSIQQNQIISPNLQLFGVQRNGDRWPQRTKKKTRHRRSETKNRHVSKWKWCEITSDEKLD